jgi:hypothetical protein
MAAMLAQRALLCTNSNLNCDAARAVQLMKPRGISEEAVLEVGSKEKAKEFADRGGELYAKT